MKALERSPGYAAFHDMQADKLWQYQEKLLSERPYEERLDDWSFVFVTTDRKFTEAERQDILTLGLLMSTGIESELYTPSRVPSYRTGKEKKQEEEIHIETDVFDTPGKRLKM